MTTNKLSWSLALAGLAGGSFALAGVLVPAVTASRAYAQVFAQSAPAPAAAPAPVAEPPAELPAVGFAVSQAAVAPAPPQPAALPQGGFVRVQPGQPPAAVGFGGYPGAGFTGRLPHGWPMIDPEQAAETQELVQKDQALEGQVQQAVAKFHAAGEEAERTKLRGDVAKLLDEQFTIRQERRTLEIKALEDRLNKLKEALKKRDDNKQTIVDRRLAELLHDDDGLGWGDSGPGFLGGGSFRFGPSRVAPQPVAR